MFVSFRITAAAAATHGATAVASLFFGKCEQVVSICLVCVHKTWYIDMTEKYILYTHSVELEEQQWTTDEAIFSSFGIFSHKKQLLHQSVINEIIISTINTS